MRRGCFYAIFGPFRGARRPTGEGRSEGGTPEKRGRGHESEGRGAGYGAGVEAGSAGQNGASARGSDDGNRGVLCACFGFVCNGHLRNSLLRICFGEEAGVLSGSGAGRRPFCRVPGGACFGVGDAAEEQREGDSEPVAGPGMRATGATAGTAAEEGLHGYGRGGPGPEGVVS